MSKKEKNTTEQAPTTPFMFKETTEVVQYKHIFTEKELVELGDTLNKQVREKQQLELDKESAMSAFKSRIEVKDAETNITSNYINDKYKHVPVDAVKRVNASEKAFEWIHPDNGEIIQTQLMTTKDIREYFPKRKDFESKNMVWYNPYDSSVVDSRPLTAEELQLQLDLDEELGLPADVF